MLRIAAFVFCSLASVSYAAPRFDVVRMSVDGNVLGVVPADLDGDGKRDLVVAYQPGPEPPRSFGVFFNRGGSFSARPDLTIPIDDKTCAFDVAELDGIAGDELLLIGRDGVSAIGFAHRAPSTPSPIVRDTTAFYTRDAKELPRLHVVHDLGKGPLLVVPLLGAIGVYARTGAPIARLPVEGKSAVTADERGNHSARSVSSLGVTFTAPAVHIADYDGDGLRDLVTTLEDRVEVFRQRAGGRFDEHAIRRDFHVRTAAESARVIQSANINVDDFDGDGIADLIVEKVVGRGLTSASLTSYVYVGRRGGGYDDTPNQTIKVDGFGDADIEPIDLTGDQRPDLVVPTITMGVWSIIRMLTTKTIVVKFDLFPFGTNRRFVETPIQRELKFKVSFTGDTDLPVVEMRGDYNGDKKPDLAFGVSDGEVGIFAGGAADGIVSKDAVETVKVDSRGRLLAIDLDHKGKDDIVLYYPTTLGHRHDVVALVNRGPW